ncbi:MAG: alanine--tRNA ligase [Patescibacteria group bacterium]|nr:alanine--tRNA ligase [Patescibacteria group bacterium]
MTANELRRAFIDFFVDRHGHKEIPGASLVPENDPTVLFTTAGMHPLVPFLMGEKHPSGTKLVNVQKCLRTDDIDKVGDTTHLTFFEMLGNWSLGDYFKEGAIKMSYEFLTEVLRLPADRLCVSCFAGDSDAPRDEEAVRVWKSIGFRKHKRGEPAGTGQIYLFGKKENWWGPAGQTGPCGPDTEMFYDTGVDKCPGCDENGPSCDCGKYVEVWNDVFMEYNKKEDGTYGPLSQKNVDTGMGFERTLAILQDKETLFETELFRDAIEKINELGVMHDMIATRIIADHLRAAVFLLADPARIKPSNLDQGYVLRRLIRRAIRQGKKIGIDKPFTHEIASVFIETYKDAYPDLDKLRSDILNDLSEEEEKFSQTLERGLREFDKAVAGELTGLNAFRLYETYGFPVEMSLDLAKEKNIPVKKNLKRAFEELFKKHQDQSRAGAEGKFSGGLADHSGEVRKLHTATHLLHKALRMVLGDHVEQRGSNITGERLRFDFNYPDKMTPEQIAEVEKIVNKQIAADLPISCEEMSVEKAKDAGAIGLFECKYGDIVKIYTMGDFSKEICGGPHAKSTGELKSFKIKKEQSSSAGIRRVKAVVGV